MNERLIRKRIIKFLFRKLIFNLLISRHWLLEIAHHETKITANAQENILKIIRRKVVKSILSPHEKKSLSIRASARTDSQRLELRELFLSLKCLDTYEPKIRVLLSTVAQYRCLKANQVIFQTGQISCAMYILLDGEVALTRDHWMPLKDAWEKSLFHTVVAGNQFGHDAFVNKTVRTYSAQTLKECELLFVYRDDFDRILADDIRFKWNIIRGALLRFRYFQLWTNEQRTLCCLLSRLIRFNPNQMVHSTMNEDKYSKDEAYFLLNGECELHQTVHLKEVDERGSVKYAQIIDSREEGSVTKYMRIGVFRPGAVFNLGERSIGRFVVAKTVAQCLLIPRFWLFQNDQDVGNVWEKKVIDIEISIPTREHLLAMLKQEEAWSEYKRQVTSAIYARSPLIRANSHKYVPNFIQLHKKHGG